MLEENEDMSDPETCRVNEEDPEQQTGSSLSLMKNIQITHLQQIWSIIWHIQTEKNSILCSFDLFNLYEK